MHIILAYLRDSLTFIRQVAIHMMDYVDAATTNILSPGILPSGRLRNMLRHIESELPLVMHLPISSDNTLHFYWYLSTHDLIADRQFLLLIHVPIQNSAQKLQIYDVFSLPVPYSNLLAQYKINHKYTGVTYDETKAVALTGSSTEPVSMQTDSSTGKMCHSNPLQTHHHDLQPYMLNMTKQ